MKDEIGYEMTTAKKREEMWGMVKKFCWEEESSHQDATLEVVLSTELEDGEHSEELNGILNSLTKDEYLEFADECCERFVDMHTFDAICIKLDGDSEDTTVTISADVHLAG